MKIVTVLKTGGDFDAEYVQRLKESFYKHLEQPHDFYCLSDDPELENEPGTIYLQHGWQGWWSKMEMYRLEPPFLYCDLDCVVQGPVDPMIDAAKDYKFVCIKPIFQSRKGAIASGLMWINKPVRSLYDKFKSNPGHWVKFTRMTANPSWNHGDQRTLELMGMVPDAYWQDITPLFVHRKNATEEQKTSASMVMFSGQPRPRDTDWKA